MDKSNKRKRHKAPSRKKRLQLDEGTTSISSIPLPPENVATSHPQNEQAQDKETAKNKEKATTHQPEASASASTTNNNDRPKSASPEPNCAICLGNLENKSFTDSCFHMFCFVCLEEWSKVKAECPLCKQTFKSIIHNVRSWDDYDQHQVQTQQQQQRPEHQLFGDMLDGRRFRYRTTVTDHRYAFAHLWENERHRQMFQRPSRYNAVPSYRRLRQPANSEFRRSIYTQKLKVKQDQVNTRRRVRETSPTFFRENPAQTHRLVPWLNRELNALLDGHGSQVAFVLDLIMGLIKRFDICSDEFYEHVYPYIGRHTRQFMDEFLHFARSPHMMAAYDRSVEYAPQSTAPNLGSDSDTDSNRNRDDDDGNDSDVVIVSPPATSSAPQSGPSFCPGAPDRATSSLDPWERTILGFPPIVRSQGFPDLTNTFIQYPMRTFEPSTSASGWDSPTHSTDFLIGRSLLGRDIPVPSSNRLDLGASLATSGMDMLLNMADIPLPSSSAPPVVSNTQADPISCNESDSESNASDIMIVDYEKPWVERSPIKLSSAEESDFEVQITGMSYPTDPVKKEKKKKKKDKKSTEGVSERVEKRKRSVEESSSTDRHKKKKKRKTTSRSRSRSIPRSYRPDEHVDNSRRSRSKSRSPIRLKLHNYSNYLHKKYNYHHSPLSTRPYYRSRLHHSISGSSTDTNSDAESHVSIRSRKQKTRSGHSSIEIVEYRKRSSKYKSGKKSNKSGSHDKDKTKHKKDRHDRKHKKTSKKKSKKGKHHKKDRTSSSKTNVENFDKGSDVNTEPNSSSDEIDVTTVRNDSDEPTRRLEKDIVIDGTSDSDADSDTDDAFIDIGGHNTIDDKGDNKHKSDNKPEDFAPYSLKNLHKNVPPSTLTSSTLELVEISPFESAAFDKDLENITKYLPVEHTLDEDIFRSVQEPPKSFKKHPHGHKKSSKKQLGDTNNQLDNAHATSPANFNVAEISNIQSSDITSCTDIDQDTQTRVHNIPVIGTGSRDNTTLIQSSSGDSGINNTTSNKHVTAFQQKHRNCSLDQAAVTSFSLKSDDVYCDRLNHVFIPTSVYESPTSSGHIWTDMIDVETLSENSDDVNPTVLETSNNTETAIDVENLSDSDSNDNIVSHDDGNQGLQVKESECHVDVLGLSDEDSDVAGTSGQHTKTTIRLSSSSESESLPDKNTDIDNTTDIEESDSDVYHSAGSKHSECSNIDQNSTTKQNFSDKEEMENLDTDENHESDGQGSNRDISDNFTTVKHGDYSDSTDVSDGDSDHEEIDIVTLVNDARRDDVQVFLPSEVDERDKSSDCEDTDSEIVDGTDQISDNEDSDASVDEGTDHMAQLENTENQKDVARGENADSDASVDEDTEHIVGVIAKPCNSSFNQAGVTSFCNSTDNMALLEKTEDQTAVATSEQDLKTGSFSDNLNISNTSNSSDSSNPSASTPQSGTPILTITNTDERTGNLNETQATRPLSIDWTANQGFHSTSSNEGGGPFISYGVGLGAERASIASPSYMETLYDRRTSGFGLSADLTFESISQSSPGQLSPVSTISDNGQDNFVPED